MKIEINNNEINEAIKDYVISQGIDVSNSDVSVDFTAGRKKGNSALVTIAPKGSMATPTVEKTETVTATDTPEEATAEETTGENLDLFSGNS